MATKFGCVIVAVFAVTQLRCTFSFSVVNSYDLPYKTELDTSGRLSMSWGIKHDKIIFKIIDKDNSKIIGIGFSTYGEKNLADFFIVTIFHGLYKGVDYHTDSLGNLKLDAKQDYQILSAERNEEKTIITIERKLDTCDSDDYVITRDTTHILSFALKSKKSIREFLLYRLNYIKPYLQRVQLIKSNLPIPDVERDSDVYTFEIRLNGVEIPDKETTYWCHTTLLPKMRSKQHIISYEGVITPASEGVIHHMELFHCEYPPEQKIRWYNAPCNSETKPMGLGNCRKVLGAWAMGAKGISTPDEAGFPIGGRNYSRYVVLEVHFNNPGRKKGIIDRSGLKFHVTTKLRKYDAAIMELGLDYTPENAIPPGQKDFKLTGYCLPQCTRKALPLRGINVFGSQLHTHLTGKRVVTAHIRNGKRLQDLNRDNTYSPHFQEIRTLPKMVRVLPGDALLTTCTYHTEDRHNMTVGGISISDEMCLNYIFYYPKTNLELCKSHLDTKYINAFFDYMNREMGSRTKASKSIPDNFNSIYWGHQEVDLLRRLYAKGPIHESCNSSGGSAFPGNWKRMRPIPLTKLEATPRNCE